MNEAFLFARTDGVVKLDKNAPADIVSTVETVLDRTVIVSTASAVGAGVILGDKVITSLLLVANVSAVYIRFSRGKKMQAFVGRRDHERNLAELLASSRGLSSVMSGPLASTPNPKTGAVKEIGYPLLVVNLATGVASVQVASTLYVTRLEERFRETWRINSHAPQGLIGGGVWNLEGRIVGLAIGERIPPKNDQKKRPFPNVYALPSEQVMDFVES